MKVVLISFAVGLAVGLVYGLIRVQSPAPPIVALIGLLGMVLGEQAGAWLLAKPADQMQSPQVQPIEERGTLAPDGKSSG
jgi:XapX domain-containing protein